ncbi:MAG: signal peptidase I [Christensenellaceae bacterium]|jgi:signal peptidase I
MESSKSGSVGKEVLGWVICIVSAIIIAVLLRIFVFELIRVDGSSMLPTLEDKQTIFVEKISVKTHKIKRFDIIIVNYPGRDGEFVKRVVGMAGDRVEIKEGYLYVNDEKIEEDYTNDPVMYHDMEEIVVPEGHCFVMGDNRNNSLDSSSTAVGPIAYEQIVGKAFFVIFPLNKIHGL